MLLTLEYPPLPKKCERPIPSVYIGLWICCISVLALEIPTVAISEAIDRIKIFFKITYSLDFINYIIL